MSPSSVCSPIVIETENGSYTLPHDQVRGTVRNAEFLADVTATALKLMGFDLNDLRLPSEFLLELAAVAQLYVWELRGLNLHLRAGLPTAKDAARELANLARNSVGKSVEVNSVPLRLRVLRVWIEQIAWNGHELLQADVVVGDVDEDEFVDVLAEIIWTQRHQLRSCLPQEEVNE